MRTVIFLFAALVVAQPATMNQHKDSVVGTWKLVSYWNVSATGEKSAPYGEHPTGFITYTADGHMSAIISADGRKPMSTGDRFAAATDDRAAAFSSFLAYDLHLHRRQSGSPCSGCVAAKLGGHGRGALGHDARGQDYPAHGVARGTWSVPGGRVDLAARALTEFDLTVDLAEFQGHWEGNKLDGAVQAVRFEASPPTAGLSGESFHVRLVL